MLKRKCPSISNKNHPSLKKSLIKSNEDTISSDSSASSDDDHSMIITQEQRMRNYYNQKTDSSSSDSSSSSDDDNSMVITQEQRMTNYYTKVETTDSSSSSDDDEDISSYSTFKKMKTKAEKPIIIDPISQIPNLKAALAELESIFTGFITLYQWKSFTYKLYNVLNDSKHGDIDLLLLSTLQVTQDDISEILTLISENNNPFDDKKTHHEIINLIQQRFPLEKFQTQSISNVTQEVHQKFPLFITQLVMICNLKTYSQTSFNSVLHVESRPYLSRESICYPIVGVSIHKKIHQILMRHKIKIAADKVWQNDNHNASLQILCRPSFDSEKEYGKRPTYFPNWNEYYVITTSCKEKNHLFHEKTPDRMKIWNTWQSQKKNQYDYSGLNAASLIQLDRIIPIPNNPITRTMSYFTIDDNYDPIITIGQAVSFSYHIVSPLSFDHYQGCIKFKFQKDKQLVTKYQNLLKRRNIIQEALTFILPVPLQNLIYFLEDECETKEEEFREESKEESDEED